MSSTDEPDEPPDHVGRILEQRAVERPDLDVSPMGVIGRLHRLAALLDQRLRPVFAEEGLGDGDFDVLATLRRDGEPFEMSPGSLAAGTMVTSGAVTKRVDRLERLGLVDRRVSDDDARARRVRLTPTGRTVVDRLVEAHVVNEDRLLAGLSTDDRARLAEVLERWGRLLEE